MKIKFFIKNKLEKYPQIVNFLLKNIKYFSFLLPHEKDYMSLNLIFKNKSKNGDIIDVGANYGQSAMSFRKLGFINNRIFLFEPIKELKEYLIKLNDNNFFVYNYGLGNTNKVKNILQISSISKKLLLKQIKKQFKFTKDKILIKYEKIRIRRLDSLNLKIKPILVKIDVEGNEYQVLSGMKHVINMYLPVLILEFNKSNFTDIYELLSKKYDCYIYFNNLNKLKKYKKNDTIKFFKNSMFYDYNQPRNIIFIKK